MCDSEGASKAGKAQPKMGKGGKYARLDSFFLPPLLCLDTFYLTLPHLANIVYYTLNCK